MSKKTKSEPIAEDEDEVTPPLATLPEQETLLADAPPMSCDAVKEGKACSLSKGHAGHHHHVPSPKTIDAMVTWA